MIKLNAPVWQTLSSAGNDAEKWLLALTEGNGNTRETIEILAEDLSHQLSWYTATAYTLPHIAAFCPKLSKENKVFLIAQMGAAIATEAMAPLSPESEAYHEFHEGLDGLRKETEALLTDAEVHALLKADAELGTMFSLGALAIIGNTPMTSGICPAPPGRKLLRPARAAGRTKRFPSPNSQIPLCQSKSSHGIKNLWITKPSG